jgi:hypothetical protein
MERVDKVQYEGLARSVYLQEGLRRAFEACHEPLPARMEQLLDTLGREELALDRED